MNPQEHAHLPTRRNLLLGAGALFAWPYVPKVWAASGRDPRFLVVVLRGGLDGLSAVMPVGDPQFAAIRSDFKLSPTHTPFRLDPLFSLNPAMPNLADLYAKREATLFHAVATPYRARSHFDAQQVLENGMTRASSGIDTGWLNRALSLIPKAKGIELRPTKALSVSATTPLILRGPAQVETWQPQTLPYAAADTLMRLQALYDDKDQALANALREGVQVDDFIASNPSMAAMGKQPLKGPNSFASAARAAASLMAPVTGPRIAVMNFDGWDTHSSQGPYEGRLAKNLASLDAGMAAIKEGLGASWAQTSVLIVTEFGRTVHVNGSSGTDHGTATVAFLVGGAVAGGRVIADWPSLKESALFEGRDLAPTTDLRAVMKGLLIDQFGFEEKVLSEKVFPGSEKAPGPSVVSGPSKEVATGCGGASRTRGGATLPTRSILTPT